MEAQAELGCASDKSFEDPGGARWKYVVMVRRQGATGEQELRHRGPGGSPHSLGVDACPDGIQGAQPLEQRAVGGIAACRPLVHVVVRINKTWHGDAVGQVDLLVGSGRRARSDL